MHPMEIVEAVDKLQERLRVVPGDDLLSIEAQKNATLFFNILILKLKVDGISTLYKVYERYCFHILVIVPLHYFYFLCCFYSCYFTYVAGSSHNADGGKAVDANVHVMDIVSINSVTSADT